MKLEEIQINDYNYNLPEERIAKYPLDERDSSKLLVYSDWNGIREENFSALANEIPAGTLLLYNNTKVIHARIAFEKKTGARIEVFCLTPVHPVDYQEMFASRGFCSWECMVGNSKKWKEGILTRDVLIGEHSIRLKAERVENSTGKNIIKFEWDGDFSFAEILENVGKIPIPPYLNRDTEDVDHLRYQTVYSKQEGSVAAPTAGLHFTERVFCELKHKCIDIAEVTLHVGAGTFQPVKTENALEHTMHGEQIIISKDLVERLLNHSNSIVAVGTTTMRTLESLFWLGVKAIRGLDLSTLEQWFWRENIKVATREESLKALLEWFDKNNTDCLISNTEIMIVPGYDFAMVDGIVTNFHQPKSTLLLLVSAFIGDSWKTVYEYALEHDFRFLSYGDSSLLWRKGEERTRF